MLGILIYSQWIGIELHDYFGAHDGAVRGVRYFACPAKRGAFVKHVKRIKKDDIARKYLKRRCPKCKGQLDKRRDPSDGIVCHGCSKEGNEFDSRDWYFKCWDCQGIDFCLKCMIKLPTV